MSMTWRRVTPRAASSISAAAQARPHFWRRSALGRQARVSGSMPAPDAPGQFGFADADRVRRILATSGWRTLDIRPVDVPCQFFERDLLAYVTKLGPVGLALQSVDEWTREKVSSAVHAAFMPFLKEGAARFHGACWLMSARG